MVLKKSDRALTLEIIFKFGQTLYLKIFITAPCFSIVSQSVLSFNYMFPGFKELALCCAIPIFIGSALHFVFLET